ncbi:MAG: hypothetical protein AVDCRST_MAG68-584 [uncultured Gemmatimonadetes bacterium]|uniref:Agenet-like domain-containing protein n=1 Tax=uncultured Gemmatimonadota bacterium TaxID=203437 RepID=A0A6J4KEI4_9BACT|nr:MAG: hypothetical protein AVDCRST_MAG68-584 [uncultured Gemmatimonadota bacterium]
MRRHIIAACVLALALPARAHGQQLRDPALPYGSWGEAERETAAAIGNRPLTRPAGGQYVVGDAVIFNDDGKRYRAHVVGIEGGRYLLHYDGFGPDWRRRVSVDALLGYQPGYTPPSRPAAAPARAMRPGDEVEISARGRWYPGRVIGVRGAEYRVHYDAQPASSDEWVPASRLRHFPGGPVQTPPLAHGKYGCTVSRYSARSSSYEFDPQGSVVLLADGRYQYLGFAQPSTGRFRVDPASRAVSFAGGHLDGGVATPMVQRPGRFYLTAPRINERWTCGFAGRS